MFIYSYVHMYTLTTSTLEHLLCPHVHWRTYVTLSYSCIHVTQSLKYVSCVFIYVPWSPSQQSRPREDMPALENRHSLVSYSPVDKYAWLPFHASAPRHACARELVRMFTLCICLCSNTPSIICTGSHPLHPLTNLQTKRERGVGAALSDSPFAESIDGDAV